MRVARGDLGRGRETLIALRPHAGFREGGPPKPAPSPVPEGVHCPRITGRGAADGAGRNDYYLVRTS